MNGIDLFAGSGGLSEGAEQAGINVKLAVEIDPHATATYTHNHRHTQVFNGDIRAIKDDSLRDLGHIHIVFGGPPCQGFSTSNQRTRGLDNSENWLFQEFLRIVKLVMPDWVIFENVTGIAETAGGFFLDRVVCGLRRHGYSSHIWELNAADYGVPQQRNRLFVVGSLHGVKINKPRKSSENKEVSVDDAISDLPSLNNGADVNWLPYGSAAKSGYARSLRRNARMSPNHLVTKNNEVVIERYTHIPEGGNWQNIPNELMDNYKDRDRCHTGIYYRLKRDAPALVIGNFRKNMLIHPTQDRGLSVREAARLQSFGDWYEFLGSIGFQQQQVGNAVPPMLAKAVFKKILSS
jgi:DNA (cytosine-5)-methyltransferase 1